MELLDKKLKEWNLQVIGSSNTWELEPVGHEEGRNYNIYFVVKDEQDKPLAGFQGCFVTWQDPAKGLQWYPPKPTDGEGKVNYPMSGDGINRRDADGHWEGGPYSEFLGDNPREPESVVVEGIGLPENRPVDFYFTFRRKGPLPDLKESANAQARRHMVPVDERTWLQRQAKLKGLGHMETPEFKFPYGGKTYIGQVFSLGLLIVEEGRYEDDTHTFQYPYPR